MEHHNRLTPAEHERLSLLLEEMGEAQQVIGKILRHGYGSHHLNGGKTNRGLLEMELGHVRHSMIFLCEHGDLSKKTIHVNAEMKAEKEKPYLHHQD